MYRLTLVCRIARLNVNLRLFNGICDAYSTKIIHNANVIDHPFPISLAVPVGLIINELLSNIIKHAFNERKEGKIELIMSRLSNGKIHLSIYDDGIGLPEGFDIKTSETLGLYLVKILTVDQLEGTIEFISNKGTTVNIEFGIEDYGFSDGISS